MKAATYNPDTLKRINQGASARDLGWDDAFYGSVCRKHGIAPVASHPQSHTVAEIAATPPIAPEPPAAPAKRLSAVGPCTFDPSTGDLQRGEPWGVRLPHRQAQIFSLIAKGAPDRPVNVRRIAERLALNVGGVVGGYVNALRVKIAPLGLNIDSVIARERSGYWVVDRQSGETVRITFVSPSDKPTGAGTS